MPIVVIDDNKDLQEVLVIALEMEGHTVVAADNGISGIQAINKHRPSLIICDIDMPDLDGDQVFDHLRKIEGEIGTIPFIFVSGKIGLNDQVSRLNAGADACFLKPVNVSLLCAQVNSLLKNRSRSNRLFKDRLEKIGQTVKVSVENSFNRYSPLETELDDYVSVICGAIDSLLLADVEVIKTSLSANEHLLQYTRIWLQEYNSRKALLNNSANENMNWQLIFLVAEATFADKHVFVSDLYVMIDGARATINTRIKTLVENSILLKTNDTQDGRRQMVTLDQTFKNRLEHHIEKSISQIKTIL